MDHFDLAGRTALVTGAGNGIGRHFVSALSGANANVIATDIDEQGLSVTARLCAPGTVTTHVLDVSDETAVLAAAEQLGPVDILVNNAAIYNVVRLNRGDYAALSVEDWQRMLTVNVIGTWLCCKAFAPGMQRAGYGKIVNISSGTALKGAQNMAHYAASKAAILGFTKSLAREVGKDGVTVNALAPGNTLSEDVVSEEMRTAGERTAATRIISRQQVPGDLLGSLLFLASPASDFMTGQTLVVDGGSYLH